MDDVAEEIISIWRMASPELKRALFDLAWNFEVYGPSQALKAANLGALEALSARTRHRPPGFQRMQGQGPKD